MAASTPVASPFKRQSNVSEPEDRNKSTSRRQENKNFDLKRKRYSAGDSCVPFQTFERQNIDWKGSNKYRPNHQRMSCQPGAQDQRMDPRDSSRPCQRSAGTWRPHRQPSHQPQRADRRPNTINNNLSHYGPAGDTHCDKQRSDHCDMNFDRPKANKWNQPCRIESKSRWERQPSFTQPIAHPVNQDILKSDSWRSQGSFRSNGETRRNDYGSEPRFRKERTASFAERVESPNGKMRDPYVPESSLALVAPSSFHKLDSSKRDNFVRSSSFRSDGSSNKESHKSDSIRDLFSCSSSLRGDETPRDISGFNQREIISREERNSHSSHDCSLYNQRFITANVIMSIPQVPKLGLVERRPANGLQDLNRWVPPMKKEMSPPNQTQARKHDSKIVPPTSSNDIISEEKRKAIAETYYFRNKDDAKIQNDSREKRVETTVSQGEDTKETTTTTRSETSFSRHPDRTVDTTSNQNGIKKPSLEKTKLDSMVVAQCTEVQELPTQDITDKFLDSSEYGRPHSNKQVLPITPVVSESPHSTSHSIVDLRFEQTEKEFMPTVALIASNAHGSNGKESSGFIPCCIGQNASSDDDSSDSDTDEEELMEWAQTMFGIPRVPSVPHEAVKYPEDSSDDSDDEHFVPRPEDQVNTLRSNPFMEARVKEKKCIINISIVTLKVEEAKNYPAASRIKRGKESEEERLERAAEAKIRKDQAKSMTAAEIKAILSDDAIVAPSTNWVRRSVRQPAQSTLRSTNVRNLIDKLKHNDSDMIVLKMKKYINDPDTPSVVIDAALDALGDNSNCEALYIQNFNKGMRDVQVLRLLEVLMLPTCQIWCLNIGETYNVKTKTWKQFAIGLRKTKVTHMYASEHTISGELKDRIRETIRNNRKKHDKHSNPNNLDVIVQCTHCWWNPINAKPLRPYLKNKGYEQLLMDKEAQGLQGSNSGADL